MISLSDANGHRRPDLQRLSSTFRGATITASILVAVLYVSSVALNRAWCFDLMTHFRVQFGIVMVPLAVTLLAMSRTLWAWAFALFTASAVWSVFAVGVSVRQPAMGTTKLRIMSANVLAANTRFEDFERLVGEVNPDILAILEYTKLWDSKLTTIHDEYPYREVFPRTHGFGIALYSKYPLHNVESVSLLKFFDGPTIFCDIDVDGQRLSIVALHAVSPLSNLRFGLRNTQFQALAQRIQGDSRPRIVLGDFNSTTWSPYLTDLMQAGQLRDTRHGFGLLPTWPQFCWPMLISIDHFLVSQHIHVHRRWVERDIGSDHFPIVVEISITPR